jgi:hypothetical protein
MIRDASIRVSHDWNVPHSLLTWPELSGEAKLAALWLWNNLEGKPGVVSFRMSELAAAVGKNQERGARRWIGYLVAEGLVEIKDSDRGLFYVLVHDPDKLAKRKADELLQRSKHPKKSIKGEKRMPELPRLN